MRDSAHAEESSRSLLTALGLVGAFVVGSTIWIASGEWFFGDDFVFLKLVQRPIDWTQVFLPFEPRLWWSYRPLTIEVYFSALLSGAGMRPFTFLLVSLLVHFGTGGVVYRLARQLEIGRPIALWTALLSVSMAPSMGEIFWASAFQTVGGRFFYLIALSFQLAWLRDSRIIWRSSSWIAMLLTLLCNEFGVTLPGVLIAISFWKAGGGTVERTVQAVRQTAPQIALLAAYVVFRWLLLGPAHLEMHPMYLPHLGIHVLANALHHIWILCGSSMLIGSVTLGIVIASWAFALRERDRGHSTRWALERAALSLFWTGATMVPFLGMPGAHPRMAMIMEPPFALFLGVHLEFLRRTWAAVPPRIFGAVLVGCLLLYLPYATLQERYTAPQGEINRQIVQRISERPEGLAFGTCLRVRPDPQETWLRSEIEFARYRTTGLLEAVYPSRRLRLEIAEPGSSRSTACLDLVMRHGPLLQWEAP